MTLHPKVVSTASGSGLGAALTIILVWVLSLLGVKVPDDVAQAFTAIFGIIAGVLAGWATPSTPQTATIMLPQIPPQTQTGSTAVVNPPIQSTDAPLHRGLISEPQGPDGPIPAPQAQAGG